MLQLLKPRDSQPQEVVGVDWSNPLARGLTALLVPTVSGQQLYNLVHGGQISATGTITRVVGPSGLGQRYGDASGTAYQTYTFPAGYVETAGSVFWKGQRNAAGPAVFRDSQLSTGNTLVWEDGAGAWNARVDGQNIAASAGSFPIDTDTDFLLTGDTTGSNFFVRGARLDTLGIVPWNWRASSFINWHQNTNNGNGLLATDYLIALYDRRLSAQEARELSANPWQLFAPRSIWVPVSSAASGTSYTITPSGGITLSGSGTEVNTKVLAVSGGVTFTGTGNISFSTTGTTYTITPSGGIAFQGTGVQVRSKTITPTGGITFSGTGLNLRTKVIGISGGVTFGGTGSMTSNTTVVTGTVGERTKVGVGT